MKAWACDRSCSLKHRLTNWPVVDFVWGKKCLTGGNWRISGLTWMLISFAVVFFLLSAFLTGRRKQPILNPAKLYLGFGCKRELLLPHRLSEWSGRRCFSVVFCLTMFHSVLRWLFYTCRWHNNLVFPVSMVLLVCSAGGVCRWLVKMCCHFCACQTRI